MNNNVSNINFTSNIKFVPYKRYKKIVSLPNIVIVEQLGTIKNIKVKSGGAVEQIVFCLAGVVKVLRKKLPLVLHLQPKHILKDSTDRKQIETTIRKIKPSRTIKGFLIGLLSQDCLKENLSGRKLLSLLRQNTKHIQKKDFTMFLFQDAENIVYEGELPESAFVYHKKNDTYYVNCRKMLNEYWHDLLDEKEIRDHFGYISVSPEDKVFIGNRQVPNKFWNKSKE
ncbi:MAG: hypothetical protein WCY19_00765 [Candidatus Gastranaerophilaceae bacterium]